MPTTPRRLDSIFLCGMPHADLEPQVIYLDVDDTLVLYRDTEPVQPSGVLMGQGFLVNHELIDRVLLHRKANEPVVVWSGGGASYAHAVVAYYIPRLDCCVFHMKDQTTLAWKAQGDIVVDDDSNVRILARAAGARGLHPHEKWSRSP